ncbi:hypothetical protein TNCV_2739411 [Trichonephila clavipes]|nr:hypothetical protein TNCV_2739411 [Trichonephila clavipes]
MSHAVQRTSTNSRSFLLLQKRFSVIRTTIFMQDGATSPIGRQVKAPISANFGENHVISRHFPDVWLSCSHDLNPSDFGCGDF